MHYVECGLCGTIRVEAIELARVFHSSIAHVEKGNEKFRYLCSDILGQIIVSAPDDFDDIEGYEKFEKWKEENERPVYDFLDTCDGTGNVCGSYDDIVLFNDLTCDCFNKDKIKNEIVIYNYNTAQL